MSADSRTPRGASFDARGREGVLRYILMREPTWQYVENQRTFSRLDGGLYDGSGDLVACVEAKARDITYAALRQRHGGLAYLSRSKVEMGQRVSREHGVHMLGVWSWACGTVCCRCLVHRDGSIDPDGIVDRLTRTANTCNDPSHKREPVLWIDVGPGLADVIDPPV